MRGPSPKKSIALVAPYVPGKSGGAGSRSAVKLSSNENALGASPRAIEAFRASSLALHRYPDSQASSLREALSRRHSLDPARLVFGAGSDEVFGLACQAFLDEGANIVQPAYAFAAWAIAAHAAGGAVKTARGGFVADVDALLAEVDQETRIVFLANPANPTGTVLPAGEVERLWRGLPERVLLILDGAYAEFAADDPAYADGLALAAQAPNVLATRTFSKLYGLAALRVGWGYGAAGVVDAMNRIRFPFNVSTPAAAAACAALEDGEFCARSLRRVVEGRARLALFLKERGLDFIPPAANFITIRIGPGAADFERALAEEGYVVRGLANYGLPEHLRVSIGTEEEMAGFERALGRVLDAHGRFA